MKSKHGYRTPKGKGKSIRGTRHQAYDSIYGDQSKKSSAKDRAGREKRLSKERM